MQQFQGASSCFSSTGSAKGKHKHVKNITQQTIFLRVLPPISFCPLLQEDKSLCCHSDSESSEAQATLEHVVGLNIMLWETFQAHIVHHVDQ